ncbi:MAG: ABC transporter permease [Deltaproteobacteria bacterium]|nr:ABC transporter permease [Deltaproteobacteria bacterium]
MPRGRTSVLAEVGVLTAAVAVSAMVGALVFAAAGAPPLASLGVLVTEPFGSAFGLSETLLKAVPLGFCALAVAAALKVNLWNIGAEGQFCMGALGATWAALYGPVVPGPMRIGFALLCGASMGALWALVPGVLRTWGRVSEILSTLLLNYVAIAWIEMLVYGPWKGEDRFPYTAFIDAGFWLPPLFRRVHAGLLLLVGIAVLLAWIERRTVIGYEVRVVGASPALARTAGLPVAARLLAVLAVAGALGGLAGACEILGVQHRLHAQIAFGYGYTAIIVAFLARRDLLASVGVAVLFAALAVGGDGLPVADPALSPAIVKVFQGVLLLAVLSGSTLVRYRIVLERATPLSTREGA